MSEEHSDYPILYVDDEPQNLLTFRYAFEDRFRVLTAGSGPKAIEVLERENVAVLVCDQRMPEMTGIEVCSRARAIKPETVRIILTAYSDIQAAIDAINQGQVLRFLTKPWRNDELIEVLDSAIELVRMRQLVHAMQARVLRGGHSTAIEAMARQVASELEVPVARLRMNTEQVEDLLTASLSNWESQKQARELVAHAQSVHRDSDPPISSLAAMVQRLARGQRLAPLSAPVVCDVVRVVRATSSILGPVLDPMVRLQLMIQASPTVRMAPDDLGQVLVHLLMNASQALASMKEPRVGVVTVDIRQNETVAEIAIGDCGPGIAPDELERIFDPCYTTREGAAGLGLAMVRHLVTQAGGSVHAESELGFGAKFLLRLPLAA